MTENLVWTETVEQDMEIFYFAGGNNSYGEENHNAGRTQGMGLDKCNIRFMASNFGGVFAGCLTMERKISFHPGYRRR